MRSNWNHSRETIIFLIAVFALFVVLILRNGGSSYMNYLHQDESRAQFEIDQSYVLLLSQAEGSSHLTKSQNKELYNGTLLRQFKENLVRSPNAFGSGGKSEFQATDKGNEILYKLLHKKREGLFIHCCYYDIDSVSIASQLQTVQGWTSLIMEGDKEKYETLRRNQHSFSLVNAILSDSMNVSMDSINQKMKENINNKMTTSVGTQNVNSKQLQDYPLGFVAKSIGRTSVDWLILSSRGSEFGILKAMIASDCKVQVLKVELATNKQAIENLLSDNGYKKWGNIGVFYNEEIENSKSETHKDVSPLLEKLRQDKMNKAPI